MLEREQSFYHTHVEEFTNLYKGKVLLIKGEELIGIFDSEEEAYSEGVRRFGNEPFLIKRVIEESHW